MRIKYFTVTCKINFAGHLYFPLKNSYYTEREFEENFHSLSDAKSFASILFTSFNTTNERIYYNKYVHYNKRFLKVEGTDDVPETWSSEKVAIYHNNSCLPVDKKEKRQYIHIEISYKVIDIHDNMDYTKICKKQNLDLK